MTVKQKTASVAISEDFTLSELHALRNENIKTKIRIFNQSF